MTILEGNVVDARELSEAVLLGPVFDALPVGVIVLDEGGIVRAFNRHEETLANRVRERVIGRPFFEVVAPCMNVRELAGKFFDNVKQGKLSARVEFAFPFPHVSQPRDVVVRLQSVIVSGKPHGLLVVEDVSMDRAVERMKESLATLLVHDFKNPLSVIRTNLDFVRTLIDAPQALEAVDDSLAAAQQLHAMVLNLLDIARLETGTFPLTRTPTDLGALISDVTRANASLARANDVEIVADSTGPLDADIDASAIRRCLSNLIENAIRHSPAKSRIIVSASNEGSDMVLRVADLGPGVAPELRMAVFDKFQQGSGRGRAPDNRGLGLTFVRMAVRAHGGDVTIVDTLPHGATFVLRLPHVHSVT